MTELPTISLEWPQGAPLEQVLYREWLLTNGLGSYASGSIAAVNTRRYHGLLTASLPSPEGRTLKLAKLVEHATVEGRHFRLDGEERADGGLESGLSQLRAFRLRGMLPEWDYQVGGALLRRRLTLVHGSDTLCCLWEHLSGPEVILRLRPLCCHRHHDRAIPAFSPEPMAVTLRGDQVEVFARAELPPLQMRVFAPRAAPFVSQPETSALLLYRIERARGLDHLEQLPSPGYFQCPLRPGEHLGLAATVNGWSALELDPVEAFALEVERERRLIEHAPPAARTGAPSRLVLAADQFIIEPVTRPADEAWARAAGRDARSVIAGYHWFTDWGRDTMISLEGLTLATGRPREAAAILRTFRHYVRDGLLPNLFPEGGREGLYHTADATLWFFHAIHRYLEATGDAELLWDLFPTLDSIVGHHVEGTRFGIAMDPADGLMRQGAPGYQLTWMDAKVEDWVVTPRRGKAVEINALWFNALRLMAAWSVQLGKEPGRYEELADRVKQSFNLRFWNPTAGCLLDVVDGEGGDDPAVRPNQLFAISLHNPVLRKERWEPVLKVLDEQLATPVGLRSLSPHHPDYRPRYDGDLRARDSAYHQGTVWAWLVGHYIDAHLKVYNDRLASKERLSGLLAQLTEAGMGQVSEIFDAIEPFRPRGCIAQAWSVAELLRACLKTGQPEPGP